MFSFFDAPGFQLADGVQSPSEQQFFRTEGMVRSLMVCLTLQAAIALYSAWTSPPQVPVIARSLVGMRTDAAELTPDLRRARTVAWWEMVTGMTAAGIFFPFLAKANRNARVMGAQGLSATPGWTIGSFLVPIKNFWRPYQILQEIWKASAPQAGDWKTCPGSVLIAVWWLQRLADSAVGLPLWWWRRWYPTESTFWFTGLEISKLATAAQLLHVVQYALMAMLVCALYRRQQARFALFGEANKTPALSHGYPVAEKVQPLSTLSQEYISSATA
jgi:hypothetical protein